MQYAQSPPDHTGNETFYLFYKLLITSTISYLFIYLFLFYFPHNNELHIILYRIIISRKKKWRGDLTETVGAHERLGLLKLQARAVYINWRKGGIKLKIEIKIGNSHLRNNLIFSIFIKKKRDWEFCWPHCHSELKSLGPWIMKKRWELLSVCSTIQETALYTTVCMQYCKMKLVANYWYFSYHRNLWWWPRDYNIKLLRFWWVC